MKKTHNLIHEEFVAALRRNQLLSMVKQVCERYGITLRDLTSGRRTMPYPKAKAEIWHWLRVEGWSYPRIADLFFVDHVTVLYGVRRHLAREAARIVA